MITITETLNIVNYQNNFVCEYRENNKIKLITNRLKNRYCIITKSAYNNVLLPIVGGQINESTKIIFVDDNCTKKDLVNVIRNLYENFYSEELNMVFFNIEHIHIIPDIQTKFVLKNKHLNKVSKNKLKSSISGKLYEFRNEQNYLMEVLVTYEYGGIINDKKYEDIYHSSIANSINNYI